MLAKPGSVKPASKFSAEIYCLTKEEGGRHTPFFKKYKPQFFFRTADVTGTVILPDELEMVMPGDNVSVKCVCACVYQAVTVSSRAGSRQAVDMQSGRQSGRQSVGSRYACAGTHRGPGSGGWVVVWGFRYWFQPGEGVGFRQWSDRLGVGSGQIGDTVSTETYQ